jgi:glycosyltransferase involved in cell wall biosynthesis
MKQLTILHTIETGGAGGAETVVLKLATRLDSARFRSLALLTNDGWLREQLEAHGVETVLVPFRSWRDMRLPRGMARIVRQHHVDLIHSHLPGFNFYSALVGAWTGTKVLATYHGPVELAQRHKLRDKIKLGTVRRKATGVVVVCEAVRHLLEGAGFPPGRITRIYNGIDVDRFRVERAGRMRAQLGLPPSARLVGMVANIRASKGHEYFVRAAKQVTDAMPDAYFVAAGDIDPELGKPLFDLVGQLGLQQRFFFLGFRPDVPEVLSEIDVFVLSSTSEGFPFVTLEAMAAGKSIVATRCGGPEEVVEDGTNGFLVPIRDPDKLAERVKTLLADPARAQEMAARALSTVRHGFTVEAMVRQYEQLYERIVGNGKG